MKLPISLVIITLNEEKNIARCIQSVPWVDDIVVVDSMSQDKTVFIAEGLGARVVREPFRGYRAQKEFATNLAKNDWVLSLDADEVLSPELSEEIQQLYKNSIQDSTAPSGYQMPRLSFYLGQFIRHGGWYPDLQLRLFDRKKAKWIGGNVHEHVSVSNVQTLKNNIHHFVFRDIAHQVDANNRYSSLGAMDLFERKKSFHFHRLLTKPISKFFETYVWKLGFLDGFAGFVISVSAAYSIFLKFAKLYYIEKENKN